MTKTEACLKIKHLGICGKIDQVGAAIQDHVGGKICLVNLTGIGAWNSDSNGNLLFNEIGEVIVWTVPGCRFDTQISFLVRPQYAVIYKKQVHRMLFTVGDLCQLKTTGRRFVFITA
jgi:hypothetical protein